MKQNARSYSILQRLGALCLAVLMMVTILPTSAVAAGTYTGVAGEVVTAADPDTVSRPVDVYGKDTENAGKVTVGKSVSNGAVTLTYGSNKSQTFTPAEDNFIVTSSQTAQVVGLASESSAPVDVVFVLDTSGSMSDEVGSMVTAANNAIKTLLQANPNNRVGVVAFSGTQGGGTSGGDAANVLSPLAHYDGQGETAHLTLTNNGYIQGRGYQGNTRLNRDGTSSGTNIQAGVVVGARELMNATNITVDGVTRIPFLVVMSDGEPSYAVNDTNWYDPSRLNSQIGRQYPANGLGFLPALTAAYYKGKITEKYFGANANADNRCFVYTLGLGLESISNSDLALMTVDPANQTSDNSSYSTFEAYWNNGRDNSYVGGHNFTVATGSGDYTVTSTSITATKDYISTYKYNDKYFSARQASDLNGAFDDVVTTIQKQAMSSPTKVDPTLGEDFSGYVTYTDPLGEYMEVKKMYGILADGNFYQGISFAKNVQNWASADQEFKDHATKVIQERMKLTDTTITAAQIETFVKQALASDHQVYYNSDTDYDNSIVWWGNAYVPEGEEDEQVQYLKFADNDSIEYITDPNTEIPTNADYVCRSYYFYGTAGGTATNPNTELMHFVIRVQRSLKAPYQQTVVISAPASLLSVEQVMITEESGGSFTAQVTEAEPARVIYEVGLRSDINAFNVDEIVGKDTAEVQPGITYVQETTERRGNEVATNYSYDAENDKHLYTFYTNDWDRTEAEDSHERAMTKVTFDAAADNSFYTYTEDTLLYVKNGDNYVAYNENTKPTGEGYYYARTVYDWSADNTPSTGNVYDAVKKTVYIPVKLPTNPAVTKKTDGWYVNKGVYKSSELTGGEDLLKRPNTTETSAVVVHPHRTENESNSHYTVYLGNNGKLTLTAETTKKVDVYDAEGELKIEDADGKTVMVGDVLTYTIKVVNPDSVVAKANVTDTIPRGTEFVSAENGGVYADGKVTWTNLSVPAKSAVEVKFQVKVTADALSGDLDVVTIDNTAYVTLDNGFTYNTNTTKNPPEGKKVVDTNGDVIEEDEMVQIPDVLTYRIRWQNDAVDENGDPTIAETVTITDIIPQGTTYVANSASHPDNVKLEGDTLTWTFENVAAGASGVVSFRVNVNANAKTDEDGDRYVENNATIKINNDSEVTNTPKVYLKTGDLALSKLVVGPDNTDPGSAAQAQEFTLNITEIGRDLNGKYDITRNGGLETDGIEFTDGVAQLPIKHGESIVIHDIPAGSIISVTEVAKMGFTPTYTTGTNSTSATEGRVTINAEQDVSVAISNEYAPTGVTLILKGVKKLTTNATLDDTTFGFTAQSCNAQGVVDAQPSLLTGEATVSSINAEATITFSPVTFTKPDTYYYLIKELNGGVTGITYSQAQYLLNVVVSDDGSGELKAAATLATRDGDTGAFGNTSSNGVYTGTEIEFTNTYAPLHAQLSLEATKILEGRTLEAGRYSFEVLENGKVVSTGTNDANGKVTFRAITYTAEGNHTYTIREVNGGLHGVEYSTAEFTVTVKVEDVDGQLVATPTYPEGGAKFTNKFTPDGIQVVLEADKILVDENDDPITMQGKEFNFVVEDAAGNDITTGMNDANGHITFAPIGYTHADLGTATEKTFTYTVREVVPDLGADPYMDYDGESSFQVSVKVTYDANEGELDYEITYPAGGVQFTNKKYPSSISVKPVATKTTTDHGYLPNDATFSFSVINVATGLEAVGGVGAANGEVNFSALNFSRPGTYKYWIKETRAGAQQHGITYDSAVYLLTVNVTLTNGKLEQTHSYTGLKAGGNAANPDDYTVPVTTPSFQNDYNAAGQIAITAKKVLNNLTLKAGDFSFRLVDESGDEVTGIVAADGTITFANLYFTEADLGGAASKTLQYSMYEIEPPVAKIPGVTYDTAERIVYITITNAGGGVIKAEVTDASGNPLKDAAGAELADNDSNVTFTNAYAPVEGTPAVITATKTLTGRTLNEGEFSFNLYHVTKDGKETLVDTTTNIDSDNDGKFDDIVFTRNYPAGVLNGADEIDTTYVIREVNNNLGGVAYDDNNNGGGYPVSVKITDDKDGGISCTVTYPSNPDHPETSNIVFVNTYDAQDTSYTPVASKELKNRDLLKDEFSFVVQKKVGTQWQSVSTGTNNTDEDGDGVFDDVTFSPIGFETAGDYIFRVLEVEGKLTGVTYDPTIYYLKVHVVDNQNGTMTATGTYHKQEDCTDTAVNAVFKNTYTPQNISVQFTANKTLTGRDMERGEFSFLVTDITDPENSKPAATGGNAAARVNSQDQASAAVIFSNIGYTFADAGKTFTYRIEELDTAQSGVEFSQAVYTATVKIINNTEEGVLEAEVTYTDADGDPINTPSFNNDYKAAPATLQIPTDKTLINKKMKAGEFTFTVKDSNGAVAKDEEGKLMQATNNDNGVITFGKLKFTTEGTYTYTVSESVANGAEGTYTLDNDIVVVVTVTDDQKGQLHATAVYYDTNSQGTPDTTVNLGGVEFINYYTPDSLTKDLDVEIGANKTVAAPNGITYSPEGFQFAVTDITGNIVTYKDAQNNDVQLIGTSDENGKIDFPAFHFPTAGEYHYWISEMDTDKEGVQIDETVWEVHILVRYDDEEGILKVEAADVLTYKTNRAAVESDTSPVFVNTYDPAGTTLHLTANKVLNGRALKDREFRFLLMDGNLIAAESYNDANGNIKFTVNYDAADIGKHSYTIVERQGSVPGVTYDTKEYGAVTVEVKDDQENGKLVAYIGEKALEDGATVATGVTLTNDYIAADTVAVIKANKELTGRTLKTGEFNFQLVNAADAKDVYTASNAADGSITFQIGCEKAGVTTYELREVKGTDGNMTYDSSVYKVTVTVTDDGKGNLPVQVTYDTTDGMAPTFYNTYKPEAVAVKLSGTKVLNGRDMTAGEFKFEVRDASGALVAYGTNDVKGVLTFTEIKFTTPGTYTLTVSEVAGDAANVTYDTTKFQVVVEITNEDGVLVAEVAYPTDGIKFVNKYEEVEEPTTEATKPSEPTKPTNPAVPDTGDHSNVTLYMVLAVVSLGACLVLFLILQKNKKRV